MCIVVIALFIQYVTRCFKKIWSFPTNENILRKTTGQNSQIIVIIIIDYRTTISKINDNNINKILYEILNDEILHKSMIIKQIEQLKE